MDPLDARLTILHPSYPELDELIPPPSCPELDEPIPPSMPSLYEEPGYSCYFVRDKNIFDPFQRGQGYSNVFNIAKQAWNFVEPVGGDEALTQPVWQEENMPWESPKNDYARLSCEPGNIAVVDSSPSSFRTARKRAGSASSQPADVAQNNSRPKRINGVHIKTNALYYQKKHEDGKYHCPFTASTGCNHTPTTRKSAYEYDLIWQP